jgi:hypothetical protein
MRLHAQTAMIEYGFVRIPETATWVDEYLDEMTVFPRGSTTIRSIRPRSSSIGSSVHFPAKTSSSSTAGRHKRPSSVANRNPLNPVRPPGSMEWLAAQKRSG